MGNHYRRMDDLANYPREETLIREMLRTKQLNNEDQRKFGNNSERRNDNRYDNNNRERRYNPYQRGSQANGRNNDKRGRDSNNANWRNGSNNSNWRRSGNYNQVNTISMQTDPVNPEPSNVEEPREEVTNQRHICSVYECNALMLCVKVLT